MVGVPLERKRRRSVPGEGLQVPDRLATLREQGEARVPKKPSEKPHERTKRLTIRRVIATYMNASPVSGTRS